MEKRPETKSGSILIRKVLVADPGSTWNNRIADIFISGGTIKTIGNVTEKADLVIDAEGMQIMPGLFDLRCRQGEPGLEQNETLASISETALAGGFTGICLLPDTQPPVQSRAQVEFIKNGTSRSPVSIYPLGAATSNLEGKELAELYDMYQGGATGFSNADMPYTSGALQRALLYTRPFGGLVFSHAEDMGISGHGFVNESENTASLGLKVFPAHAEYTSIATQLEIARYTNSRLHISHLSSARSVELIRKAKEEGLSVSCDVSILHLIYNDSIMSDFDANLKLLPPLRSESDRLALIEGVCDGTIDCIVSDHNPQCSEHKVVEFNYAPFGAITLQQLYSLYTMFLSDVFTTDQFVKAISYNPRRLLGLGIPTISEGNTAEFSIFDPEQTWTFGPSTSRSLSLNSNFYNTELKGRCIWVIRNDQAFQPK